LPEGEAGQFIESGATELDGDLPVNTSGGLKSKGHPIGATGAGQVVEAFKQLSGTAGERQVENPTRGLTHNVGGSGGASVIHIFEREEQRSSSSSSGHRPQEKETEVSA